MNTYKWTPKNVYKVKIDILAGYDFDDLLRSPLNSEYDEYQAHRFKLLLLYPVCQFKFKVYYLYKIIFILDTL